MKFSVEREIVATLALSGLALTAEAQITASQLSGRRINTITTAVPFLMITPDSRAGGMGDAGVASSADANSIHWNTAKLAFAQKNMGFALSYTPWLRRLVPDINLGYLSGFKKMGKDQAIAASLRYFSLGNIQFTDINGNNIGQFNPNEFAVDVAYSRKLSDNFSGGMALRYIFSNLTNNITVQGANTRPGQSVAADLSGFYNKPDIEMGQRKGSFSAGLTISNIGAKVRYSENADRDFIPINMRIGAGFTFELDKFNSITILYDLNKLMVPSPPVYARDSTGAPIIDPATGEQSILSGKDPDRGIVAGMFGSFNDAPDGFGEEMREFTHSVGMEYWYDKLVAFRAGYFYEAPSKGNRQFVSLGAGLRYNVFGIDFAYLIPTIQQHPLQNTLRFTLIFDLDSFKSMNKGEKTE
jgi:hypothetical protein